ncbi:MAG: hypothetical protein ABL957_15860, partial [Parvularculaceae bacterium]
MPELAPASAADAGKAAGPSFKQRVARSLSAKLFLLTIAFVLVAEMLVLIPAISRQRIQWLNARIEADE